MNRSTKFFIGIGIALIILGILLVPYDEFIGAIGILFGSYNLIKGIRLAKGIKPFLLRKQEEKYKQDDDELRGQLKDKNNDK